MRDPVQWHYMLFASDWVIEFASFNLRLEVRITGQDRLTTHDWHEFFDSLVADFEQQGSRIGAIRRSLTQWLLSINPFARLSNILKDLEKQLKALNLNPPPSPPTNAAREEIVAFHELSNTFVAAIEQARAYGVCLRMLAPVLAESFVNLLIFLLVAPEVRNDPRHYNDLLRRQIDIRLRDLFFYCDGFEEPVDLENDSVRRFLTLMNQRNDLLHGNLDLERLQFGRAFVGDDGGVLFETDENLVYRVMKASLRFVEPEHALNDLATVRGLVQYLVGCLSEAARERVDELMDATTVAWSTADRHPSILFPNPAEIPFLSFDSGSNVKIY